MRRAARSSGWIVCLRVRPNPGGFGHEERKRESAECRPAFRARDLNGESWFLL